MSGRRWTSFPGFFFHRGRAIIPSIHCILYGYTATIAIAVPYVPLLQRDSSRRIVLIFCSEFGKAPFMVWAVVSLWHEYAVVRKLGTSSNKFLEVKGIGLV